MLEGQGFDVPATSLYVKCDNRMKWSPEKNFIKLYPLALEKITNTYSLNLTEIGIILKLSLYIRYEDNLLCLPSGDPLMKKDLIKILGIGHNSVDKYIANLVTKGILEKIRVEKSINYYINPCIVYQGNMIDNELFNIFNIAK